MRFLFCLALFLLSTPGWAISESNITKLVESAPEVKTSSDLSDLVEKWAQRLTTDEDKAYAFLTWIVKNIDYDDYKKNQIEQSMSHRRSRVEIPKSGDILKTRLGVCEDISRLYQKMITMADMKGFVISGCTSEVDSKTKRCKNGDPGHTWNVVWIKDRWEFVDPTWAMTGKQTTAMTDVTKKRNYEKELKKRERRSAKNYNIRTNRHVDKKWFMTDPKTMAEDHYPLEEKWLLTKLKDRKNKKL